MACDSLVKTMLRKLGIRTPQLQSYALSEYYAAKSRSDSPDDSILFHQCLAALAAVGLNYPHALEAVTPSTIRSLAAYWKFVATIQGICPYCGQSPIGTIPRTRSCVHQSETIASIPSPTLLLGKTLQAERNLVLTDVLLDIVQMAGSYEDLHHALNELVFYYEESRIALTEAIGNNDADAQTLAYRQCQTYALSILDAIVPYIKIDTDADPELFSFLYAQCRAFWKNAVPQNEGDAPDLVDHDHPIPPVRRLDRTPLPVLRDDERSQIIADYLAICETLAPSAPIPFTTQQALAGLADPMGERGFGVEIELIGDSHAVQRFHQELSEQHLAHPIVLEDPTYSRWSLTFDGSLVGNHDPRAKSDTVHGRVGIEVVSPILYDQESDWEQLRAILSLAQEVGLMVNEQTGLHISTGAAAYEGDLESQKTLIALTHHLDDMVYRLASDPIRDLHRMYTTRYGMPLPVSPQSHIATYDAVAAIASRQTMLHMPAYASSPAAARHEWRVFDGTLDPGTIQTYIGLCLRLDDAGRSIRADSLQTIPPQRLGQGFDTTELADAPQRRVYEAMQIANVLPILAPTPTERQRMLQVFAQRKWQPHIDRFHDGKGVPRSAYSRRVAYREQALPWHIQTKYFASVPLTKALNPAFIVVADGAGQHRAVAFAPRAASADTVIVDRVVRLPGCADSDMARLLHAVEDEAWQQHVRVILSADSPEWNAWLGDHGWHAVGTIDHPKRGEITQWVYQPRATIAPVAMPPPAAQPPVAAFVTSLNDRTAIATMTDHSGVPVPVCATWSVAKDTLGAVTGWIATEEAGFGFRKALLDPNADPAIIAALIRKARKEAPTPLIVEASSPAHRQVLATIMDYGWEEATEHERRTLWVLGRKW